MNIAFDTGKIIRMDEELLELQLHDSAGTLVYAATIDNLEAAEISGMFGKKITTTN
jgi:hypothetical protein